jgi:tetratricopeptide (TPR) repeat protein
MNDISLAQMLVNAKSAYEAEEFEQAAQWYERASHEYTILNDPLQAAEMANNRSVAILRSGDPQNAFSVAKGTDQIFAQAGDQHRQAMALGNQAAALEAMGQIDQAIQYYQRSNDLLKQLNDQPLRAYVLQSLSGLYLRRRRYLDSLVVMEAALEIKENLSLREKLLKKLLQVVSKLLGRS